jgi:hypothetical protein
LEERLQELTGQAVEEGLLEAASGYGGADHADLGSTSMPKPEHFAKAGDLPEAGLPGEVQENAGSGNAAPAPLEQTGQEADEMWHQIQIQMMSDPDLPEDYTKALERIPEVARELVNRDLIHVPPPM